MKPNNPLHYPCVRPRNICLPSIETVVNNITLYISANNFSLEDIDRDDVIKVPTNTEFCIYSQNYNRDSYIKVIHSLELDSNHYFKVMDLLCKDKTIKSIKVFLIIHYNGLYFTDNLHPFELSFPVIDAWETVVKLKWLAINMATASK